MSKPSCDDVYLLKHRNLKNQYHSLTFGEYRRAAECRPGQFVHIMLPATDILFRRAFSVADVRPDKSQVEILLKVYGRGSTMLARLRRGDRVNLLGPLGKPFRSPRRNETVLMIAGGIGVPPVMFLAAELVRGGFDPKLIEFYYGGRSAADIIERTRIRRLGIRLYPVTEDGSLGSAGLVSNLLEQRLNSVTRGEKLRLYACGPEGMLTATNRLGLAYKIPGQLALEAPMPCGIGICLGCVVPLTNGGYARVCCDGPVFDIGEVAL